jgi:signal transduction histidine kinase
VSNPRREREQRDDRRQLETWISIVRFIAIPFALAQVALTNHYPDEYKIFAWLFFAAFVVGTLALQWALRGPVTRRFQFIAMAFDFAVVSGFVLVFSFQGSTPVRQLLYIAIVLGALRFGIEGGVGVAIGAIPVIAYAEDRRAHFFGADYRVEAVAVQAVAGLLMGLLVGWLYERLAEQREEAERRADEAESLRDELGRRADLLDAANRCARTLSSSLDFDEAFDNFIRELQGLVPFDRIAVVLYEDGIARMIATSSGLDDDGGLVPGTEWDVEDTLFAEVIGRAQTIYREDMTVPKYVEEPHMLELGLRSRVAAPLLVGARAIGHVAVSRCEAYAFEPHEIELMSLLGRLAGSAIQNIRAYESERRTVEELRRLSALRADFVSLVSHEMRSPMAAVIGAARTLQQRWRELQPEQREAFLALIGDETNRLANLIGDVLDTSRIDAGTFSYRFVDVDLAALVHDSVNAATVGQDEIPVVASVTVAPAVRGDPERLRQVLGNLIDNAVKYSPSGRPVQVRLLPSNGAVTLSVSDEGPGIARDDQRLIFEKFGRVAGSGTKPGTGLGLYIARSIAEAHGGTIEVTSAPGRGATFTLKLPSAA